MRLALELGLADYIAKNGFRGGRARDLGRHRLGGHGCARGRGARAGASAPRLDALALLVGGDARDARRVAEAARHVSSGRSRSSRSSAAFDAALAEVFAGTPARPRGGERPGPRARRDLLMALSNKFGWLLVATGNKSEYSVGYATLYGDMAGGFALLKDVYKTDVFRLAGHLNERAGAELIPQSIIDRAPSAELRAEQRDEDSLPPYAELDRVLEAYVELDRSREELSRERFRPGDGRARARTGRPGGVQAPPGAAGGEAPAKGVRPRPPAADHEPLARLDDPAPPATEARHTPVCGAAVFRASVGALPGADHRAAGHRAGGEGGDAFPPGRRRGLRLRGKRCRRARAGTCRARRPRSRGHGRSSRRRRGAVKRLLAPRRRAGSRWRGSGRSVMRR